VAEETLRGAQRGKYVILPGSDPKWMWKASHLLGCGTYKVMDFLLNRARKRIAREQATKAQKGGQ